MRRALQTDPQSSFAVVWLSVILRHSNREQEALEAALRGLGSASNVFDLRTGYNALVLVHLRRNDLPAARKCLAEGRDTAGTNASFQVLESAIALRAGMKEEAARLLTMAESSLELNPNALMLAIEVSLGLGEMERALAFAHRGLFRDISQLLIRLNPVLHPLLDQEPFTPRVSRFPLV